MADETIRKETDYSTGRPVDRTYDRAVNADTEDCSSSDAGPAAAMGGLGGAATGAIAGAATGPAGAVLGAVIGGVAGAVASGVAVGAVDRFDEDDAIKGETCDTVTDTSNAYTTTDTTRSYSNTETDPMLRKSWDRDPTTVGATDFSSTGTNTGSRFEDWDSDFRSNWQTNYTGSGSSYDEYQPAYRYGYFLYSDQRYMSRDWPEFENEARSDWETRQPGTWERFKNSIRYGWERAKAAVTGENRRVA